jgi:hypothetical protein
MRVRKASIAGVGVNPNALSPPIRHLHDAVLVEAPYELTFSLGDLRPAFFRHYADWLLDMREFPDPDDELEAQLRGLGWPSLGVLAEVDAHTFAVVLLALGSELLIDLEWGRDPLVPLRWALASVDEVELTGRRITARGVALELPGRAPAVA